MEHFGGPVSQLGPVEVPRPSPPAAPHEGDQLLCIDGGIEVDEVAVGGLHLLPTNGRE